MEAGARGDRPTAEVSPGDGGAGAIASAKGTSLPAYTPLGGDGMVTPPFATSFPQ